MSRTLLIILLAVLAATGALTYLLKRRPPGKNVILVVLDTTRADHLGLYGYERDTTPNLDAFAKDSTVFDYAVAAAPWTPPSIAAIMTGLYVSSHGLMPPDSRQLAKKVSARLDSRLVTLAEMLHANGYRTAGVTPNPWTSTAFGFEQGFEKYIVRLRARADEITKVAFKLLDEAKDDPKPKFLFVHYLDPHDPYDPPKPYDVAFSGSLHSRAYPEEMLTRVNPYDGEIKFLDHHLGELFNGLKARGMYDDSLIIVVADHGEQFKERGQLSHGYQLYDEEVHIPLIVRDGKNRGRVDYTVSNVDVYPTVLAAAGLPALPWLQGISLFDEKKLLERPGVMTEIKRKFNEKGFVSLERKKLILDYGSIEGDTDEAMEPSVVGVFDTKKDPFELSPLRDESLLKTLRNGFDERLKSVLDNKIEAAEVEIEDDMLEQLKSLGYLK